MNTYNFTAYNTLTIHADVPVEAKTLKEAIAAFSLLDPNKFDWEVSDWSSASIGAHVEEVVIDGDQFNDETVELEWVTTLVENGDWQFSESRCRITSDIDDMLEIEALSARNELSAAVDSELNNDAQGRM